MVTQVKTLVCFGDSNIFGALPTLSKSAGQRYVPERRWSGILRRKLRQKWDLIEEGHPCRTTVHDDPIDGAHVNGLKALPIIMESQMPVDLVILALGTNDLKFRFSVTANDIADGLAVIVRAIQRSSWGPDGAAPKIMIMSPTVIKPTGHLIEMFRDGEEKSQALSTQIQMMAELHNVSFFDTDKHVQVSTIDGVHFESHSHRTLAQELAKAIEHLNY